MEKIHNMSSVRDTGLVLPIKDLNSVQPKAMTAADWDKFFQDFGKGIGYQWLYRGQEQKILWNQMAYKVFEFLADETGFLVLPDAYRSPEAKILNGDLSVRCTMHPTFNVRGFSPERLEEAKRANLSYYGHWTPTPHFKQQSRANRIRNDGTIEIEGNDGLADCMYFFDSQTGALVGAEPFTWSA